MKRFFYIILIIFIALLPGCDSIMDLIDPPVENQPPTLLIKIENDNPDIGTTQVITAEVYDPDQDDEVTVSWNATDGELSQTHGLSIEWTAPDDTATVTITAVAKDSKDEEVTKSVIINVGNAPPVIKGYTTSSFNVISGNDVTLTCDASDPEGDELTYDFQVVDGLGRLTHESDDSPTAIWTSPSNIGQGAVVKIAVFVSDPLHFTSTDTVDVLVYSNYGSLWVVDGEHKTLSKYTSNGLKILTSAQAFELPVAVIGAIDELGGCFVADQTANQVFKIDYDGNTLASYSDITHVIDIALQYTSQKIWALSYSEGTVSVIDQRTAIVERTINGFFQPTQIEINQYTGDVWIVEEGNDRIFNFNVDDQIESVTDSLSQEYVTIFDTDFNGPMNMYLHYKGDTPLSHVYVADTYDNQVERFVYQDSAYVRYPTVTPLSTFPRLLGVLNVNLTDMLMIINQTGSLELMEINNPVNKHVVTGGYNFAKPQVMKIDQNTNECWIGDNGTNQLVKIRINGNYTFTVLRRLDGFLSIRDLTINR